jgi:hypothetical protein
MKKKINIRRIGDVVKETNILVIGKTVAVKLVSATDYDGNMRHYLFEYMPFSKNKYLGFRIPQETFVINDIIPKDQTVIYMIDIYDWTLHSTGLLKNANNFSEMGTIPKENLFITLDEDRNLIDVNKIIEHLQTFNNN